MMLEQRFHDYNNLYHSLTISSKQFRFLIKVSLLLHFSKNPDTLKESYNQYNYWCYCYLQPNINFKCQNQPLNREKQLILRRFVLLHDVKLKWVWTFTIEPWAEWIRFENHWNGMSVGSFVPIGFHSWFILNGRK